MGFQSKKQSAKGIHRCPNCDSILVQPVNWHGQGDGNWNVELRCPDCEWWGRGRYSQDELDRYDDEMCRGDKELIGDLRALIRANMNEERIGSLPRSRPTASSPRTSMLIMA
jgi:hypothetical protein